MTANCISTCGATWEDSWQLSDPFGTRAELIPPNINVSTYYDDTPDNYCGATATPTTHQLSLPNPVADHACDRAKVYAYEGSFSLPDGSPKISLLPGLPANGHHGRVWLHAGLAGVLLHAGHGDYISTWNLDLITDRHGNQIHITYQQDKESKDFKVGSTDYGTHYYIRDAVLSSHQLGLAGLSERAGGVHRVILGAADAGRLRRRPQRHAPHQLGPSGCNTGTSLRCDDPLDLSGSERPCRRRRCRATTRSTTSRSRCAPVGRGPGTR